MEPYIKEAQERALDILHDCIIHTPLKLGQTNRTQFDEGYIFYQDMVIESVESNEQPLRDLIANAIIDTRKQCLEEVLAVIPKELIPREGSPADEHNCGVWNTAVMKTVENIKALDK